MERIERFGVAGKGIWIGEDNIWRFDDNSTYELSEPENQTLVGSNVPNRLVLRNILRRLLGTFASRP